MSGRCRPRDVNKTRAAAVALASAAGFSIATCGSLAVAFRDLLRIDPSAASNSVEGAIITVRSRIPSVWLFSGGRVGACH